MKIFTIDRFYVYGVAAALLLLFTGGCAPVISQKVLDTVDRSVSFSDLKENPDLYKGKRVLLGGTIVEVRNLEDRTVVEVLEQPLSGSLRPVNRERSGGRFLVTYSGFKDPAVYSSGRAITVVGTVEGKEKGRIGRMEYTYPVIAAEEDYLWGAYRGPEVSLGIGIFGSFDD